MSAAPDDHVKLLLPDRRSGRLEIPRGGSAGLVWPANGPRPVARDYTPRRVDATAGELEIDVVLHAGGAASSWAETATTGAVVGVAGPRGSRVLAPGFDAFVLAADETGLPAVARWLRELPAGARANVVVEVEDAGDEQPLPSAATVGLTWVHRAVGGSLAAAIRTVPVPAGTPVRWAAAEASAVAEIRQRWLEAPGPVIARGYWRRGVIDHQEPHDD